MSERNKRLLLGGLILVWAIVAWLAWPSGPRGGSATTAGVAPGAGTGPTAGVRGPRAADDLPVIRLRTDLLERDPTRTALVRDLFSASGTPPAPAGTTGATGATTPEAGGAPPTPQAPVGPGAALRYLGYVDMGGKLLVLLREGPEMYLAHQGDRVGPGYVITEVGVESVEIEFRGARRRLPVSRPDVANDGRQPW